jgi:hypothetical protein
MKAKFLEIRETGTLININKIIGIFPVLEGAYEIRWEVCGEVQAQLIDSSAYDYYWCEIHSEVGIIIPDKEE